MKKNKFLFLIVSIFILLLATLTLFWAYSGGFEQIIIAESNIGPYHMLYKDISEKENKLLDDLSALQSSVLNEYHIDCKKSFVIYYQGLMNVNPKNNKVRIGLILDNISPSNEAALREKYNLSYFELRKSLIISFPYLNRFSVMLGKLRIYPKVKYDIKVNKKSSIQSIEIYDQKAKKIYFIFPLL